MHAGWPYLDDTLSILFHYPQVNADLGAIDWLLPRAEFHNYLHSLMRAGFGKRLMFGTDQMYWPEGIAMAVDAVHSAPFLSPGEKRDIFYSNAARFYKPPLPDLAVLRSAFTDGRMRVLGEVTTQYAGLTLDDPKYAPYLALAEELDIPVALHTGTMPPGMSFDPCDLRYPISIDEERAEHLAADPGSDVVRRYRTKPPVKSRYPLSNSQSGR